MREGCIGFVEISFEHGCQPLSVEHGGAVRAGDAEPLQCLRGVAEHHGRSLAAQIRSQVRHRRRDRASLRQRASGVQTFGHRGPPLGVARAPEQGEDQGSVGDQPRGMGHGRSLPEPLHPLLHDVDAATRPDRLHRFKRQILESIRVAGEMGVIDGRLEVACRLETNCGARVQLRDELGTVLAKLGGEHLAEEGMVAIPLPASVQRLYQEIPAPKPFEQYGRVPPATHSLAQLSVHLLENRSS